MEIHSYLPRLPALCQGIPSAPTLGQYIYCVHSAPGTVAATGDTSVTVMGGTDLEQVLTCFISGGNCSLWREHRSTSVWDLWKGKVCSCSPDHPQVCHQVDELTENGQRGTREHLPSPLTQTSSPHIRSHGFLRPFPCTLLCPVQL